jgi:hypothetical protein
MLLDRFRIQPQENRKFTIEYADRLQNGNLLASLAGIVVTPVLEAPSVPFSVSGGLDAGRTKVILWATQGESGNTYQADIKVTTVDGQTWEDEIQWIVEEI